MLKSKFIDREDSNIGDIPIIRLLPKNYERPLKTVIFYHGWSGSKDSQFMRGMILAGFGYQVIIPDSIHHGQRGNLNYKNPENLIKYFWPTVLQNLVEYSLIKKAIVEDFDGDIDRMGVIGNSMGGISASGIFTYNPELKALVVLNGTANWDGANIIFKDSLPGELPDWLKEEEKELKEIDPMNNLERIVDRPVLLLHGDSDIVVDKASQKDFYKKAYSEYEDRNKIHYMEYSRVNHTVTTSMMEDSIKWFDKFL